MKKQVKLFAEIRPKVLAVYISMRELGIAMINTVNTGYDKSILECRDIANLAKT